MRRSLALFSIAAVLPLVVVGVGMGAWSLKNQRSAIEERAAGHATFVATLMGRELAANIHSTQMITQSPGLDGSLDKQRLAMLAARLVADEPSWRAISVSDATGTRLLDIPRPIGGRQGGPVVDLASHRAVATSAKPAVGRVMAGPQGRYAFAVRAPAIRDDKILYVVSTIIDPSALASLLLPVSLPKGWATEVVDGAGVIVAHSGDGSLLGKPAGKAAIEARSADKGGFYRGKGPSGQEEVATFRSVPGTDWTVHVAIPAAAYAAPLIQAGQVLVIGAIVSLLLSALLALLLVRELRLARKKEDAAFESQRLEALGQMTGGVAHDFNNLLTPILGGLDLLRPRVEHDPRAQRLVEAGLVSAERARALVSRLLSFARRQALETRDVDVAALLGGLADLLERSVGPDVKLVMTLPDDLPTARVDPAQLELAVLNLAVNARDAMPAGGTLAIEASPATIDHRDPSLSPGLYLRISLRDTGVGMDEATLRRAVEPFFTTKLLGKGTGLGLSMVHGLAAQSGGALKLASEVGVGTRADIYLPVGQASSERNFAPEGLIEHRAARLLLVDDDDLVRVSTADLLKDHGHEVIEARSAFEALSLIQAGEAFEVLITDYAMPGKNGAALVREARVVRADLPALLITGFADYRDELPADVILLAKPFRRIELLNRVARLLPEAVG